jgi:predicted small secreted protein
LETIMRRLMLWTLLAASLAIAACNTVEGAGKDVSAAGHAVTDTAQDAQHH